MRLTTAASGAAAASQRGVQPGEEPHFKIALSDPGSGTGADIALNAAGSQVTTTITDNDTATWSISGDSSVAEGD